MYRIDLQTAEDICKLLESVDKLINEVEPSKEVLKVIKKAKKLDNMKTFLKENL